MGCTSLVPWLFALSGGVLRPHWVAQFGGFLGVTLAVNQHQRILLVVVDDVGEAAEILQKEWDSDEVGIKSLKVLEIIKLGQ